MKADFDRAAKSYDEEFTFSAIGKLQRDQVYRALHSILKTKNKLNILELNCGTGEDAIYLNQMGHQVVASDISEEMLQVARSKAEAKNIEFVKIDIKEIDNYKFDKKFDLIFSNFGGLNCVNEDVLRGLSSHIKKLLTNEGKFIPVIISSGCLWETLFFTLRGKRQDAFRRAKGYSSAVVNGSKFNIWYYSPRKFNSFFKENFMLETVKPIGFFVPPSYLNKFFSDKRILLSMFSWLDKALSNISFLSNFSDHYYLQLKLK